MLFLAENTFLSKLFFAIELFLCESGPIGLKKQFDCVLEEDGVHKSLSLYKEKRFTKLGYLAGAVYDCLPYFRKLLTETPLNNLLIWSCKLYVKNPLFAAGFKALAIFTYQVTMPYLNFVENMTVWHKRELGESPHENLSSPKS